jgi:small subunit ribosomal protein S4
MKGNTGDELMTLLERRLDNVVFRLGLANTRREARQLVNHGHFTVNGKRVNIPSYLVKVGDVVAVCDKSRSSAKFKKIVEDDKFVSAPKWLEKSKNAPLEGKVVAMPARDDIDFEVAVNLIVELYSK